MSDTSIPDAVTPARRYYDYHVELIRFPSPHEGLAIEVYDKRIRADGTPAFVASMDGPGLAKLIAFLTDAQFTGHGIFYGGYMLQEAEAHKAGEVVKGFTLPPEYREATHD